MVTAAEPVKVESINNRFGKGGILAKLFANTLESMMDEDLTDHSGNEPYEAKGRNSSNSRNDYYSKGMQHFWKDKLRCGGILEATSWLGERSAIRMSFGLD